MSYTRLPVTTPTGDYEVVIGAELLGSAADLIRAATPAAAMALVTDENVWALYGAAVAGGLRDSGVRVVEIVVPAGEASKSWQRAGEVCERLAEARLDRTDAVVALGGGVVGDLAGFCAAVYLRGIDYVQVPTTLLAQVDSSVGGKTGVDLAAGKNLAGAFKQPSLVLADVSVLATLPGTEWTSGLAEVAKVAMLESREMVDVLIAEAPALLGRDEQPVVDVVLAAVRHKAAVVAADEREAGERESLNYGHTLGHAIEQVAGYGAVPHGIAVAEGMRFAALLAEVVVGAPEQTRVLQDQLLDALGIERPTYPRDARRLLDAMHADKKARSGTVRYVFVPEPGRHVVVPVDDATIAHVLDLWFDGESERG